jgi:phosphotriesterase-related protein
MTRAGSRVTGSALGPRVSGQIRTVLGDVPAASIGRTLIHEHLVSSFLCYWTPEAAPDVAAVRVSLSTLTQARRHAFAIRDNLVLDDINEAIAEVGGFRSAGGATIVEATSLGIGRDVRALELIARGSSVNIVAGCGYYIRRTHPRDLQQRSEASLAAEMAEEINEGVAGTGIRAGVLGELGVGTYPMHPAERKVLRAAVAAQAVTGAGLVVHPAPGIDSAFELVRVLERAGARMDKVVVSHLDERFRGDVQLFRRIGTSGCRFGFDTFGREIFYEGRRRQHPADQDRIRAVETLIDAGLGDRIVLAQDICMRHELSAMGGQGYDHVMADIIPRLHDSGVGQEAIDRMLVHTPAQVLVLEP